jgi:hypothetical protein
MIDKFDAAEIGAGLTSSGAHFLFVAKNCNSREPFASGRAGGGYGSGILTFG